MSFIRLDFVAFFAAVFAVYWALRDRRSQNVFLLVASFVFYGWVNPWLTLLLLGVTATNYTAARAIAAKPERKDAILAGVIVASVVNLCTFKYFGWFASSVLPLVASPEQAGRIAAWNLVLPLGLSFYTFHNLAYTIDVYRERIAVRTDPVDYFLYGSFFPQLVAGPVERADHLLPQLEAPRAFDWTRVASGLGLALWGAFKKVALADTIAPYVDLMYSADHPSWAMLATGALGFTVQALADFSGYTDIARGTARMLGIELMDNFDHPYMAATPMEFWQRWHMSFSTWLRDYIYVPACFSDWVRRWLTIPGTGDWGPFASTSRALLITMVVSGLWHGSSWNFVVWGLYYAVIGTIYAWIVTKIPRKMKKDARWRWVTVPVMFGFTVFGMNIFRESSLPRLWAGLHTLPWEGTSSQWVVSTAMLGLVAYASLPLVVALIVEKTLMPRLRDVPFYPAIRATWWAVQVVAVFASVRTTAADFIYFQF